MHHTNDLIYTAYTSGTTVYVEKVGYDSNGALETIHTLSFETEDSDATFTPVSIYDLSITGIEGTSVLIAYGLIEDQTQTPQFRVRRIDTQNDKFSFNYCGFYVEDDNYPTEHSSCSDLYNQTAVGGNGEIIDDSNVSFISGYSGQLDITFNGLPDGTATDLPIITASGTTVIFRFGGVTSAVPGTDPFIVGYCTGATTGVCTNQTDTSNALYAALTNDSIATVAQTEQVVLDFLEEFYVSQSGTQIIIEGPNEFDTYDNIQKITPVVGQITVDNISSSGNYGNWYLPYSDAATNMQLGIARGDEAHVLEGLASGTTPGHTALPSSGVNNQEIANVYSANEDAIYIATKNSNANLDVHKVDVSAAATLNASNTDIYSKGSYDTIDKLSISIGSNDYVYVSNISTILSTSTYNLGAAVLDVDLVDARGNIDISAIGYEKFVEDIDNAYISADPNNDGEVIIAITSNNSNSSPNNAYLIKLDYAFDTITYPATGIGSTVSFNFHEHNYPALNTVATVQGGAISATNIHQLDSKGYTNDTSIAEDQSRFSLFFGFHESDTGNKIKTGFFNIEEEKIMTDDTATSGNFPAIIGQ